MKLQRDGWLARMFFWQLRTMRAPSYETSQLIDRYERQGVDLCTLARTVFIVLPLQSAFLVGLVGALLWLVLWPAFQGWRIALICYGVVGGGVGPWVVVAILLSRGDGAAVLFWRAKKLCPLVGWEPGAVDKA